eukprot:TRINITY_DN4835_c0_g1_i1.p1 TRINITY_DN4835_c0_g1~~TRINITY_DN4835_c0_g1_i1.p1  ORF type:complete len:781 (+),score=107.60 TRINITY_DN4835_c0_g1_i1:81-2345(+)
MGSQQRTERLRAALHERGFAELGGLPPEWELKAFVERIHQRFNPKILQILDSLRSRWQDSDEGNAAPGNSRPGAFAARLATAKLKAKGVYVYATHPSQDDDAEGDAYSGPRWYVSIMEAVALHYSGDGCVPYPPSELAAVLWPREEDACRPWLTEAGWTVVPECSDPQVLHADICGWGDPIPDVRKEGIGRYHHVAWKLSPQKSCTTNVVPGAFTEGFANWKHYGEREQVKGAAVVIDSEMLHCGAATGECGWSSTLTLQLSSGEGWPALHTGDRVSKAMIKYTFPVGWEPGLAVDFRTQGQWQRGTVDCRDETGLYSARATDGSVVTGLSDMDIRRRVATDTEAVNAHEVGSTVEVEWHGSWHPATVTRVNADGSYRVNWLDGGRFTDGVSQSAVRSPRNSSKRRCISPSPACNALLLPEWRKSLHRRGWAELEEGLPAEWQEWAVAAFARDMHARFHRLVVEELESLRPVWDPAETGGRHGAFAAAKATERLSQFGIAVHTPPSCQEEAPPFRQTGPRWYVSVTKAAFEQFGSDAPPPPYSIFQLLCGSIEDARGTLRARGLGWTLAPPGSDPQSLHADLWGTQAYPRDGCTRYPHILWKADPDARCTTQIVPGAFTQGHAAQEHFGLIERVSAPAIIVDSEMLHRGGPTPAGSGTDDWVSSLSLELCTQRGWDAWCDWGTGGTTKPEEEDQSDDWAMLRFKHPSSGDPRASYSGLPEASRPVLRKAQWSSSQGMAVLRKEQGAWEAGGSRQ